MASEAAWALMYWQVKGLRYAARTHMHTTLQRRPAHTRGCSEGLNGCPLGFGVWEWQFARLPWPLCIDWLSGVWAERNLGPQRKKTGAFYPAWDSLEQSTSGTGCFLKMSRRGNGTQIDCSLLPFKKLSSIHSAFIFISHFTSFSMNVRWLIFGNRNWIKCSDVWCNCK